MNHLSNTIKVYLVIKGQRKYHLWFKTWKWWFNEKSKQDGKGIEYYKT